LTHGASVNFSGKVFNAVLEVDAEKKGVSFKF
jgi:hypothetical protein